MKSVRLTYEEIQARSRQRLMDAKPQLIGVLKSLGVSQAVAEYDGEGDSGQITMVYATGSAEEAINIGLPVPDALREIWSEAHIATIEDLIEAFAWGALGVYHDGFEIDGGGFGTLTINVDGGTIVIDHNDRIVDVIPSETEF